jgi:predicted DNA-binding protein (UPF0251 family)
MPRPRIRRLVANQPRADYFKPRGLPISATQEVTLPVEGLEALRLADVEGMEQQEAAELMGVSRPTFSRILAQARGVVSQALVHGWALRIEGGDYRMAGDARGRGRHGRGRGRGAGRGGGRGPGRGQGRGLNKQTGGPGLEAAGSPNEDKTNE